MQNIKKILSNLYKSLFIKEVYEVNFNNQTYFLINKNLIKDYDLYLDTICELEYDLNKEFDTGSDDDVFPYIIQATEYKNIEKFSNKKTIFLTETEKQTFSLGKLEKKDFLSNKYLPSLFIKNFSPNTHYIQKQNSISYTTQYNIKQHNTEGINYDSQYKKAA